jgi:hypothetical protein
LCKFDQSKSMNTTEIRTKLHEQIEHSDDRLLKMVYALMNEYKNEDDIEDIGKARKKLIHAERENYLAGVGKSYSWEEVKKMAVTGQKPYDL